MRKIVVNVSVGMTQDQYTDLAADIIEAASNIFKQLTIELDAEGDDDIIINLTEDE